jgi:hypothetical protein
VRILERIASFALSLQHDPRTIVEAEPLLLSRRSLTLLNILRTGLVRRSWDFWIGVRCDDNRHHGCEIGCEESRIDVLFCVGFESGVEGSVIGRADNCQSDESRKLTSRQKTRW